MSNNVKPKYQKIVFELQKSITSGEYKAGDRLPSEADLVESYSTSRLTVQRAMKELQHLGLIERRAGSGTFVRRMDQAKGHSFGLLIPGLGETEIFEPICQAMACAGRVGGHALLWGDTTQTTGNREQQTKELCEYYISQAVSGIFFAPVELMPNKDEINRWIINSLDKARIPVVLLDRCFSPYPQRSRYDLVGIDNRRAGFIVTDHLLRHGCERLVFLAVPYSAPTVDARIAGFREALETFSISAGKDWIHIGEPDDAVAVRETLDTIRPDGFVCANDMTAARLMRTLEQLGVAVPDQIRIAGFDDVKYAGLLGVPLTTVHQPCREIGEVAIWTMLDRMAHPALPARDILLSCSLVARRSCGSHTCHESSTS